MALDLLNQLMGQTAPPDQIQVNDNLSAVPRAATREQLVQKHGLGNILSILGDAFLASHGLQPQYLPKLQAAREADALDGYDNDPLSAITRLQAIDPQRADQMRNDLYRNIANQQLARTSAAAQAKDEAELPGIAAKSGDAVFASMANLARAATPQSYPAVRSIIQRTLTRNGLSDRLNGLPDVYDPDAVGHWARGSVSVDKQDDNERQDKSLGHTIQHDTVMEGIAKQNADTNAGGLSERILHDRNSESTANRNADTAATNATTNQGRAADYRREVDDKIKARAWNQAHPSKNRVGVDGTPPFDPAKYKGKSTTGSDGSQWHSDGSQWIKG